jgi:hypothetical protein
MSFPEFPKFYRDRFAQGPIGEVRAMDEFDALHGAESSIHAAVAQVGLDIWDARQKRDAVISAATQLVGLHAANIRFDSALGDVVLGALIDAVKDYQGTVRTEVFDIPGRTS